MEDKSNMNREDANRAAPADWRAKFHWTTVADKAINRRCGLHNIWVQELNFPRVLLQ